MIGPRRDSRFWVVAMVLPLLALRALVPAGFMAAPVAGAIQIVFCEPGAMAGHHHPGHDAGHQSTVADPTCPFAQSAGPAPLPSIPVLAADSAPSGVEPILTVSQTAPASGPERQQTPRGPPTLA
ncbi:MAG: hypothetical protein NTZ79_06810 [Proteobacteria bacterium]|nr:hypothetical protein [Pseudomonadota bacterium]